jgi:hypothetical protein
MDPRKIVIGESYHAKRPRRLRPITGPGIVYGRWQVLVLAKGQTCQTDTGREIANGLLVQDEKGDDHLIEPGLVLRTWAASEARIAQREAEDAAAEAWDNARETEIADAHITMCAHLQSRGIEIPEHLLMASDDYRLTPAQILELTGAGPGQIAAAQIRPYSQPREEPLPEPISPERRMRLMLVLEQVEADIAAKRHLNETDPVDLTGILSGMGAPDDAMPEPVIGHIREWASSDSVASRCQRVHSIKVGQTRQLLSQLRKMGLIWHHKSSQCGWTITPAGRASLAEWQGAIA